MSYDTNVQTIKRAMHSPHCVRYPKHDDPQPHGWSVIETSAPYRVVRGPFGSEREAIDALVTVRCEIAVDELECNGSITG